MLQTSFRHAIERVPYAGHRLALVGHTGSGKRVRLRIRRGAIHLEAQLGSLEVSVCIPLMRSLFAEDSKRLRTFAPENQTKLKRTAPRYFLKVWMLSFFFVGAWASA